MAVAEAAVAPLGEPDPGAGLVQVGDQGFAVLVQDLGAHRHLQHHVGSVGARAVAAHAVDARLGLEVLLVAVVDQGVQPVRRLDPDVSTASAIAAVGATELDELLAPERHGAAAPVAGANVDLGLVEEFHRGLIVQAGGCVELGA